jgi:N-acetylneuraminic acid mutarotase
LKNLLFCCFIAIIEVSIFIITCSPTEPEKPKLSVNPTSCVFTKNVNIETLILSNSGGGELSWEITDKPDWLEASKSSGKVTTEIDTVIITADINQAAGTYTSTININSNDGNQVVNISLDISIWINKKDMPTARYASSASDIDGYIFVIGGQTFEGTSALSTVEVYDPATDSWTTKTPMAAERYVHCTAAFNGIIYVFGGDDGYGNLVLDTEAYDPKTDTWTSKADLPTGRGGLKCAVVNGKIYVMGGGAGSPPTGLNVVEEYDPVSNTWTSKADMQFGRWGFAVSVVDEIIYAIGGQSYGGGWSRVVEAYDPSTDTWTLKSNMLTGRTHFSASAVNAIIYAIGGGHGPNDPPLSINEAYDPVNDTWIEKVDMPTARFDFSIGVVNDKIYVFGGAVDWPPSTLLSTVEEYEPGIDTN